MGLNSCWSQELGSEVVMVWRKDGLMVAGDGDVEDGDDGVAGDVEVVDRV